MTFEPKKFIFARAEVLNIILVIHPPDKQSSLFLSRLLIFLVSGATLCAAFSTCGSKEENQDEEENLELSDTLETPYLEEETSTTLALLQGERVLGESLQSRTDTIHVIADLAGSGRECDLYAYIDENNMCALAVKDEIGLWRVDGSIDGLSAGKLPKGWTLELAVAPVTSNKSSDMLVAVGDGSSEAHLTIFTPAASDRTLARIGSAEGESRFQILSDGGIRSPYGSRGIARQYRFNGATLEEIQEPAL